MRDKIQAARAAARIKREVPVHLEHICAQGHYVCGVGNNNMMEVLVYIVSRTIVPRNDGLGSRSIKRNRLGCGTADI